MSDLILIPKEF